MWALSKSGELFWRRYGISNATLKKYKVYQLESAWCNDKYVYRSSAEHPAFAYWFGDKYFKLYFPFKDNVRFICNTDHIQGAQQLPATGDNLIITKSLKDVMVLSEYGIPAIAPQSEVHPIMEAIMYEMKQRFKNITLVYDFDYTGVKNTNKLRKQYDLNYAFVDGAKDISDLQVASPYHAQNWVNNLING